MDAPILVATDLSARSDRAVDRAVDLADALPAPLKVVHVVKPQKAVQADLEEIEQAVRASLRDPARDVEILLPEGSPPETIARVATAIGAGLIVAGVARYNQITDFLLGTAIDHLVRHVEVPVLVVKQRPQAHYQRILVPCDFSDNARRALLKALELFPQAHVDVIHAFHVPYEGWKAPPHVLAETLEQNEKELADFLADPEIAALAGSRIESRVGNGGTLKVVYQAIRDLKPDLLVVGTQGMSGFRQATLGSTASDLLASVPIDTLMVPPAEA